MNKRSHTIGDRFSDAPDCDCWTREQYDRQEAPEVEFVLPHKSTTGEKENGK